MPPERKIATGPQTLCQKQDEAKAKGAISRRNFLCGSFAIAAALALGIKPAEAGDPPKVINGIETWGYQRPLSQTELYQLLLNSNAVFEGRKEVLEEGQFYLSVFIPQKAYQSLLNNESPQSFLLRHVNRLDRMIKSGNRYTNDTLIKGLAIRRLVVIEDGVDAPVSHQRARRYAGFKDSDGLWEIDASYTPEKSSYYHADEKIDYGLLHEWGHRVLYLPDQYALDASISELGSQSPDNNIPEIMELSSKRSNQPIIQSVNAFTGVPHAWQEYITSKRNDRFGNTLMNSSYNKFGPYESLQLYRRVKGKWTHKFEWLTSEAMWDFPNEVPAKTIVTFGKDYAGSDLKIYRTDGFYDSKQLENAPIFSGKLDTGGSVNIYNPFENTYMYAPGLPTQFVPSYRGDLFIKVIKPDGTIYFRWFDIRELNAAFWLGQTDAVGITMNLAAVDETPESFHWNTEYFTLSGNPIFTEN